MIGRWIEIFHPATTNDYGPYTLDELQRCVARGSVVLTDLARSEGMTEWVPVSQVIPSAPVLPPPVTAVPPVQTYAGVPAPAAAPGVVYSPPLVYHGTTPAAAISGPMPPDLDWIIVLVISLFCGIFHVVWFFIELAFVTKIRPQNKSLVFILSGIGTQVAALAFIFTVAINGGTESVGSTLFFYLLLMGGTVLQVMGVFRMRDALVEYYNTVEPIGLRLDGVMTFFFHTFYFQYHFCRIAQWKKTGYLQPQQ